MRADSRPTGKAPTIIDVAAQAGVSIKTVSRVVNQEPGVNEITRAKVLEVVAALKYRPKLSARSLAGARSFIIGLLYYDPSAAFVAGVQQGATLRCREAGYHLVVESLHGEAPDLEQQVERVVQALRPDGMLLTPPLCDNPKVLKALQESGTPCVLMSPAQADRGTGGAGGWAVLPSVRMDEVKAAEELTELLIQLGHRRIALIQGATDQSASSLRHEGFSKAMAAHGLDVDPALVYRGDFTFRTGVEGARHLLGQRAKPTAIFASNDDMALGVLAAANQLGLRVPQELSVVGFDDSPAATLVWPPLTTVRQPTAEMARVAVEILIGTSGDDDAPQCRVLAHELVERHSTAPPRD